MGEYAIRKSDRQRIKIGTCSDMFYIRYGDRDKVIAEHNSVDIARHPENLRFRLPFPDEDRIFPGDYENYNRALRLYRTMPGTTENFIDSESAAQPGTIQLTHKSGLLLNVPCYHGGRLPDVAPQMKAFWNGGSGYFLALSALRTIKADNGTIEVWPIVQCIHCGEMWRKQWAEIWDFIEEPMQKRLAIYRG